MLRLHPNPGEFYWKSAAAEVINRKKYSYQQLNIVDQ